MRSRKERRIEKAQKARNDRKKIREARKSVRETDRHFYELKKVLADGSRPEFRSFIMEMNKSQFAEFLDMLEAKGENNE